MYQKKFVNNFLCVLCTMFKRRLCGIFNQTYALKKDNLLAFFIKTLCAKHCVLGTVFSRLWPSMVYPTINHGLCLIFYKLVQECM